MAPRRKFGLDTLDEVLERDGAKTDFDRDLPVQSKTLIKFECVCGQEHEKRLDHCLNKGMFCQECMKTEQAERSKTSRLASKLNVLDVAHEYLLTLDDGTEQIVDADEEVVLMVAPEFLTRKIYYTTRHGNNYWVVSYWNIDTERPASQRFRISNESEQESQRAAAASFLSECIVISRSYTILRSIKELAAKPSWSKRHLRIAPHIVHYDEQPVPLDPYLLGSWFV